MRSVISIESRKSLPGCQYFSPHSSVERHRHPMYAHLQSVAPPIIMIFEKQAMIVVPHDRAIWLIDLFGTVRPAVTRITCARLLWYVIMLNKM